MWYYYESGLRSDPRISNGMAGILGNDVDVGGLYYVWHWFPVIDENIGG